MTERIVTLGSFRLVERIGRGGMGEVWRGVHQVTGGAVAVKVLTSRRSAQRRVRQAFMREVQALSGLHHPNIVGIYDCGQIDRAAEAASAGELAAGCPWMAMELANEGTLADRGALRSWGELRGVLVQLLDALAHAHARDVIHRDIKPQNVLLMRRGETTRCLLTDFGVAWALGDYSSGEEELRRAVGSVHYIAPEQVLGDWRDQGPWTDLYAVGCLAWQLCTGQTPFAEARGGVSEIIIRHLHEKLPPLRPRFELPEGAERWLRRLLGKSPFRRFWRAADALYQLLELGWGSPEPGLVSEERERLQRAPATDPELSSLFTLTLSRRAIPGSVLELAEAEDRDKRSAEASGLSFALPYHLPSSWRAPSAERPLESLPGAGLGVLGMRALPLIGREQERDALWSALYQATHARAVQGVVLSGEAGLGKTRLATWLCERAHELGVCFTIRVPSLVSDGEFRGLQRVISDLLRLHGLRWEDALARTRSLIKRFGVEEPFWVEATANVACPRAEVPLLRGEGELGLSRAEETRFQAVTRVLRGLSSFRTVVLFFDDAHQDPETLRYLGWLLRQREAASLPLLFVLTTIAGEQAEREQAASWAPLAEHPAVAFMPLEPMPDADIAAMLCALIQLDEALLRRVVRATKNNPLFALQLLGDWIQRGLLEYHPEGFSLASGVLPELPANVQGVWASRLELVYGRVGRAAEVTLAVAAAIGGDIVLPEWRQIAALLGVPAPDQLLEALLDTGLLMRTDDRWAFVHRMLREHIEETARKKGLWSGLHRAIAETLERSGSGSLGPRALRIGVHFRSAGAPERAIPWLLHASRACASEGDFVGAVRALDLWQRCLSRLNPDQTSSAWITGWLLRAELDRRLGRFEEAVAAATRAERLAEQLEADALLGQALLERGVALAALGAAREERGLTVEGVALLGRALALLSAPEHRARCELALFRVHLQLNALEEAEQHGIAALTLQRDLGDPMATAEVKLGLADLALVRQGPDEALRLALLAREVFEQRGALYSACHALLVIGEARRLLGQWSAAERDYRLALNRLEGTGTFHLQLLRLGLARTLVHLQRHQEALNLLDHLLHDIDDRTSRLSGRALCVVIAASAGAERLKRLDEALALLGNRAHPGFAQEEGAALELAAESLTRKGHLRRAVRVLQIAAEAWMNAGDIPRAESLFSWMLSLAAKRKGKGPTSP